MNNYHHRLIPDDKQPALIFLMLLASLAAGFFIAAFFASLAAFPFIGEAKEAAEIMINPSPDKWWPIMVMQLTSAFTLFILTPYLFIKYILKTETNFLFKKQDKFAIAIGATVIATICFMMVNTVLIEWNSQLVLPEFLNSVENYIRNKEDSLAELTLFLTKFEGVDQFLFTLIVIAAVPAIGEEFLFRGILQTAMEKYLRNPHAAIILTAIIFSAFHFQFYGFLPRMALGVLFGYLFYYSGNLIYPMIAHFINNGLTVTMIYLFNINQTEINIENQEPPSIMYVLIFLVIGILFMFTYYRLFQKKKLYNG